MNIGEISRNDFKAYFDDWKKETLPAVIVIGGGYFEKLQ